LAQSGKNVFGATIVFNRLDQNLLGLLPLVKSVNLKEGTRLQLQRRFYQTAPNCENLYHFIFSLDGVFVFTPTDTHAALIQQSLNKGQRLLLVWIVVPLIFSQVSVQSIPMSSNNHFPFTKTCLVVKTSY
jgi:hypothetical protein